MNRRVLTILLLFYSVTISQNMFADGWLTIHSSLPDVSVMIDENEAIAMHDKQKIFIVDSGLHLVITEKEGYFPRVDTITVQDGKNHQLNVWLEPLTLQAKRRSSKFQRTQWEFENENERFKVRWVGIGGGVGTGLNLHLSFFQLRYGILTMDPCLWGCNLPFFSGVSHVQVPWQAHPRDRRSEMMQYQMAIPSQEAQIYYAPQLGVLLPCMSDMAVLLSAGPQISWTRVVWAYQYRDLPTSYKYVFTQDEFPTTGYQFDPVWFSVQAGILFTRSRSDVLIYFSYQDGYFLGVEFRF